MFRADLCSGLICVPGCIFSQLSASRTYVDHLRWSPVTWLSGPAILAVASGVVLSVRVLVKPFGNFTGVGQNR